MTLWIWILREASLRVSPEWLSGEVSQECPVSRRFKEAPGHSGDTAFLLATDSMVNQEESSDGQVS